MQIGANPHAPGSDEYFVHEALLLAESCMGWTSPNPPVGSVIVREGRIIGRGAHRRLGDLHAEALAVMDAGDARGATCFISLEPCSHVGRQPSCCDKLLAAGVSRVVWGSGDNDPRSAGRAAEILRSHGIETKEGVLAERCSAFLEHYLRPQRSGQVFAHLKLASSMDGKIACANGASQWLSGPESLGLAHYLRWKYDGILVGYRTVLADNPKLTLRSDALGGYYSKAPAMGLRQPVRVVLDPRFELCRQVLARPEDFEITRLDGQRGDLPGLIFAGASEYIIEAQLPKGWHLLAIQSIPGKGLDLGDLHVKLYQSGLRSLLIEGGAGLAQSLIEQRSLEKLTLVTTPVLVGADGLGFSPELNCERIDQCPRLLKPSLEILGQDCAMHGYLDWPVSEDTQ